MSNSINVQIDIEYDPEPARVQEAKTFFIKTCVSSVV